MKYRCTALYWLWTHDNCKWNLKGSKNIARLCYALCTAELTDQTEFLNLSRICIHKIKNKFAFKEFYTYFRSAKFSEIPTEMKSLNFALQNSKNKLNNWKVNASRKYAYAWLSNKRTEYLEVNEFICTSKILFKENHSASKTFWKIETAHAIFWMYLGGMTYFF